MFDQSRSINSSKTILISPLCVSTKNFNPLSSVPAGVVNQLRKDGELFQKCLQTCEVMWKEMRKNDLYSKGQISLSVIEEMFKSKGTEINSFLKVRNAREFMNVFDRDCDGYLNSDEQILVFSVIKERMYQTAQNLLIIQSYVLFKSLMRDLRKLQVMITGWQNQLRKRIQARQLAIYQMIGQQRVDDFCNKYQQEFKKLQQIKRQRRQKVEDAHEKERLQLQEYLQNKSNFLKFKPRKKLFQLQIQEKLVSIEERVDQALDFRKELKEMQKSEAIRVGELVQMHSQKCVQKLQSKYKRIRQQLQQILTQLQNNLIIKMRNQFDITLKKNHIHENSIKRIMSTESNWAHKEGTFKPQLQRTKNLQKKRNQILKESKSISNNKETSSSNIVQSQASKVKPIKNIKSLVDLMIKKGSIVSFQLSTKSRQELPINSTGVKGIKVGQVQSFLAGKKKEDKQMFNLSQLYNQNLQLLRREKTLTEEQQKFKQKKSKEFLLSKMTIHNL